MQFSGLLIVVSAAITTAALLALLRPMLVRVALATPNARSSHRQPTPQGGGIAVVAVTIVISVIAVLGTSTFSWEIAERLLPVLGAGLLLAGVGALDDVFSLGTLPRLLVQGVAVAIVLAALPADLRVVPLLPEWLERGLLFVGGVAFVNIVNFMDGIDWMLVVEVVPITAGVALIGALDPLAPEAVPVALSLGGAMIGFAPFNRPVARLFLGDVGSLPIGLLVGWLMVLVASAGHLAAALLLPLYFIADATVTLLRRLRAGEKLWEAHRTHFYQRASDKGFNTMQIVGRVFAVNVGLVLLAVTSVVAPSRAVSITAVAVGCALVAWTMASFVRGRQ
jgi:UDP-N-acetylmuramyl pentapeptide phosphotransferase/UDP-N-acetylglucosamine-1-phosphate transferase